LNAAWAPTSPLPNLHLRARVLAQIRAFFTARGVLEVETPTLSRAAVSDLHLGSLSCRLTGPGGEHTLYLRTSPEYAMKRLLAAGSGAIYEIARAFRDGEAGRHHNPEFTLLEWYRPRFDHHRLMDEVEELLAEILGTPKAERLTCGELFETRLGLDPHASSVRELRRAAAGAAGQAGMGEIPADLDRDALLDFLLGVVLEPELGRGRPTFLHDFPASMAALARIRPGRGEGEPPVAERFEVYVGGVELANGFHELTDAAEQRRRFEADLARRRQRGLPEVPMDEHLLAALEAGLPPCAGVALGVDRLVMLAAGARSLEEVLAFPIDRA